MLRLECLEIINQLKLNAIGKHFDEIVTECIKRKRSTLDILHRLLKIEQAERQIEYRINQGKFSKSKSLAVKLSPLNKPAIELLMDNKLIETKRNIIFVGGPGTGKTHLATAIGINAASCGKRAFLECTGSSE